MNRNTDKNSKAKTKKRSALFLAAALSLSLAAGCGDTNASQSDTADTASSEKAGQKTTIEFFNQKTEIVDILKDLIAEYESAHPDVQIELTTPADAPTVLSSRMASDDTPDIFTQWPNANFYTQVDSGYVMDLSSTGIMDNIQDVARDQWKYQDGEYAAAISYNCSGIWYNKDIFADAGITEIPATWEELVKDCKILETAGVTPFVTSAKETDITDRQLQVFLASSMGDDYEAFESDAGAAAFDVSKDYAKNVNDMAEKMIQIIGYSQADTMGTDQDSATANFANKQGAMMIGGSWLLASITAANPEMNLSMMPIPGDTAEETNTCAYPGDMALCIAENTKVKKEAVEFLTWMTSTETAAKYAKAEGNPSCIKEVDYVAPQFEDLYGNYVTVGKFILNPDCNWTSAQQDAAGAAVQQLYYDLDASAFAENLSSAFNDN